MRETQPSRTATEQLLISTAAERAAEWLDFEIPPDSAVYLRETYFESFDEAYALGAIRERIVKSGGRLVGDETKADVIAEPRSGALSIDEDMTLIGLPAFQVPIPFADTVETPEIALFKRDRKEGVAKFALTLVRRTSGDPPDGRIVATSGPVTATSKRITYRLLFVFGWTDQDIR